MQEYQVKDELKSYIRSIFSDPDVQLLFETSPKAPQAVNESKKRAEDKIKQAFNEIFKIAVLSNANQVMRFDEINTYLDKREEKVLAYEKMLKDKRSPPNIWKRRHEEMEMKTRYAVNANRASWI